MGFYEKYELVDLKADALGVKSFQAVEKSGGRPVTAHILVGVSPADIATGRAVLAALSPFDIGQAVVVIDRHVVGVEGIEGTDALLARIAELRAAGDRRC